jgi:hypothetical protein
MNESLIARGYVTWFDLTNMKVRATLTCAAPTTTTAHC